MEPTDLLAEIMPRMPMATPAEIFRMAMLVCHAQARFEPQEERDSPHTISQLMHDVALKLAVHEDQHAAISEDLDSLASTEPCQFSVQHLWTLMRAIKVQSQLLELYLGPQAEPALQ